MNTRALLMLLASAGCAFAAPVRLWETNLVIPTYLAAPPSPVPRFYEGRTYQGAKATFYPYPVQDVLTDIKTNKSYKALFLENDYIQISVIPELGGRIWSAMDKANGYDFFYRQHVVKPALIGMLGAWISGGVEWNVPHHHRATSFSMVDHTTTTNADGSATIWVGEIELRHRMKWLVGMTLYPDRSYLDLTCKMFNRTPFAHPMLFWINTAVHANTNYQVIFPPSTEWAAQHSKPEFASWPIARQFYGGTDYTRGVDISWWKNHDTPKSFFAWNYEDDWFGGYDHGKQAGVIHVADHHVAPGKKFFEWGNGPEGETWSKILTDDDGPYLELMAGAWSDNQPDYSWIQPGETREWKHWWYPVQKMSGIKAATRDAALNLEVTNRTAKIAVNATREFKGAKVRLALGSAGNLPAPSDNLSDGTGERLQTGGAAANERERTAIPPGRLPGGTGRLPVPPKLLLDQTADLSPVKPFAATVMLENDVPPEALRLSVFDAEGKELVSYQPTKPRGTPMPKPVEKPKSPKDYATTDELYFTGQRIEQLYSPSFEARPYYEEILRRDPGDYRANTALGILLCKQWRWAEAAKYLSNAIARATANHIRPKDGEAFYYQGVALRGQAFVVGRKLSSQSSLWSEKLNAAKSAFQLAGWSAAWLAASYHEIAEIECCQKNFEAALDFINRSLAVNECNTAAANLRSAILRQLGRNEEASRFVSNIRAIDPLDAWSGVEQFLANNRSNSKSDQLPVHAGPTIRIPPEVLPARIPELLELVVNYSNAGFDREATDVSWSATTAPNEDRPRSVDPILHFYAGYFDPPSLDSGWEGQYYLASRVPPSECFPFQFETVEALNGADSATLLAQTHLHLGNLLYDNQPENAIKAWEESRQRDGKFALTHRNLALAYAQHEKNIPKAIASLEKAVELDPKEPRFFYELDVQYEAGGAPVAKRLAMLTNHHAVVAGRDDALTREIVLLTVAGQAERALALLRGRHFRNWEGSSQIHSVYVDACLAHGQQLAAQKKPREALAAYQAALEYPENLEVGRARRSPRTAQIQYLIGTAHEGLADATAAKAAFDKAAAGRDRGASESSYFHALALQKLGRADEAKPIFERLIKTGEEQLTKGEAADYFAKFGEKTSERVRQANAHYLIGLGQLGLGEKVKAEAQFKQVLELHPAHLGASLQVNAK